MVGRNVDGTPLLPIAPDPIPGVKPGDEALTRSRYEAARRGLSCPIGAHVRRANPRTADYPSGTKGFFAKLGRMLGFGRGSFHTDLISSTRFHRLLRRGREYGPGLSPDDAVRTPNDGIKRGLRFICLNASISRQFEFVQTAWIMGTKFAGLTDESDPLLGNRTPIRGCIATDTFSIPREEGLATRIEGVPRFITVRGGAYFFLPGIR